MTALFVESDSLVSNPLDLAEQVLLDRDWAYDRPGDEELVAEVNSIWGNYRIWFTWQPDMGILSFSCAFETKLPDHTKNRIYPLLAMVNEKLWVGHFDMSTDDKCILFRHGLLLKGTAGVTSEQLEELIDLAITECERFYPAFQSVVWGGKNAEQALQIAIFDTVGEA